MAITAATIPCGTPAHGAYMVTRESVDPARAEILYENVNDGTVEGLRYSEKVLSIQFAPEFAPSAKDSEFYFEDFLKMAGDAK